MSDDEYYYYSDEDEYSMGESGGEEKASSVNAKTTSATESKSGESKQEGSTSSGAVQGRKSSLSAPSGANLEYLVLSPDMLQQEQEKVIRNVSDVLDTPYDVANVLLLHYRWNKEKLFDAYYADPEKACQEAGAIVIPKTGSADGDAAGGGGGMESKEDGTFLCNILFIDVPYKYTFSMGCKSEDGTEHRFSLDAWQSYLCSKVEEGKDCIFARCPMDGCTVVMSPKVWEKVLSMETEDADPDQMERNKDALNRYQRALATSFVDINKNVRWCPGKNCSSAVQASGAVTEVKCTECSTLFCFKCGQESHAPISCKLLTQWQEKCQNESETANYILSHTKSCSKCGTRIEKNQGCNHMTCRVCKYDFCWICMGPWSEHGTSTGGYYNCNKFKQGEEDSKVSNAKRELDRYLHYYKRYAAHMQAGKFATEQREKAERRMVEMQSTNCVGWIDVQFLEQAVEQLIDCRRVLKYTYAFAYYLPAGPKKDLFEYNQSMLESHTEKLSELSELELDKMDRSEVINFTRVTGKFLKSLLEQVETEGIGLDNPGAADGDVEMEDVLAPVNKKDARKSVKRSSSASAGATGRRSTR